MKPFIKKDTVLRIGLSYAPYRMPSGAIVKWIHGKGENIVVHFGIMLGGRFIRDPAGRVTDNNTLYETRMLAIVPIKDFPKSNPNTTSEFSTAKKMKMVNSQMLMCYTFVHNIKTEQMISQHVEENDYEDACGRRQFLRKLIYTGHVGSENLIQIKNIPSLTKGYYYRINSRKPSVRPENEDLPEVAT